MTSIIMSSEYFFNKVHADTLIDLVNYIKINEIEQENLEDSRFVWDMLHKGMNRFKNRSPTAYEFDAFKSTILSFTIDYLKSVHLYRINRGILLVACVEYLLYPTKDDKECMKVYRCSEHSAVNLYNKLLGLPKRNKLDDFVIRSAKKFFRCEKFLRDKEYLEIIRSYLKSIEIDSEEMAYIKHASIQSILFSKRSGLTTPETLSGNEQQLSPQKPVVRLANSAAPSDASTPENHGFTLRFSLNQIILARKSESPFWPAQITELSDHEMRVKFFAKPEETGVITSEEDVKNFYKEEIDSVSSNSDEEQKSLMSAVESAMADLKIRVFC